MHKLFLGGAGGQEAVEPGIAQRGEQPAHRRAARHAEGLEIGPGQAGPHGCQAGPVRPGAGLCGGVQAAAFSTGISACDAR